MTAQLCIGYRSILLNTESVKPVRTYRSKRRQEQAAQTRRDILAAAGALFRVSGYAGTSVAQIAAGASVAVETIYKAFGGKRDLFKAVVESAVAGGSTRAALPVEERPAIRAVIEEPDPRRQLELFTATQPGIHRRSGPLLRALRDAAASDRQLGDLWREMESTRLNGQRGLAAMLQGRESLRDGLSVDKAADTIWTLCSLAVYEHLVIERGWPDATYAAWLAECLAVSLLGPQPMVRAPRALG